MYRPSSMAEHVEPGRTRPCPRVHLASTSNPCALLERKTPRCLRRHGSVNPQVWSPQTPVAAAVGVPLARPSPWPCRPLPCAFADAHSSPTLRTTSETLPGYTPPSKTIDQPAVPSHRSLDATRTHLDASKAQLTGRAFALHHPALDECRMSPVNSTDVAMNGQIPRWSRCPDHRTLQDSSCIGCPNPSIPSSTSPAVDPSTTHRDHPEAKQLRQTNPILGHITMSSTSARPPPESSSGKGDRSPTGANGIAMTKLP
jgi:hypothetical protein